MKNKQNLFKNLACVSFCLFTFFLASIFVSETYYNRIINQQIQDLSLLKSSHFQEWGSMKSPSSVIHEFAPYVYDEKNQATLLNDSIKYQYTYEYKNYSFTQGNTGNVRYLNKWKRQLIQNTDVLSEDQQKLKVFNVDAESVYNYDYYAPTVRQFTLTYNVLYQSLIKQFLPYFYACYMFEYLFKNQTMVYSRVFKPLGLTEEQAIAIYSNPVYGLSTPQLLSKWVQLSQTIQDESFYSLPFYQSLINDLKLTNKQIMYIVGPKSSIAGMLIAIKSALKYKMNKLDDNRCSDDFCTDQQLIGAQLGVGFLTKQSIFTSTKIDKYINQLNLTLLNSIEYSGFCDSRPDLEQCSGDDNTAAISFFIVDDDHPFSNPFSQFDQVEFILNNLNNPESLELVYQIPGEGKSIAQYVKFLYNNTFNLPLSNLNVKQKSDQFISSNKLSNNNKNVKQNLNDNNNINTQAFKRSLTNYNHLQSILTNLQSILYVQLHTRAFYNKFINTDKKTCQQYYPGDFDQYKTDCTKLPLSSIDNVRVYVKAYLGVDNSVFLNSTTIPSKQLINSFFHNTQKSLFAQQMSKLSSDLSAQYKCLSKPLCSEEELFFKEWKNGQILSNLPKIYFPNDTNVTIKQWDNEKKLNNVQPQLYKYVTVSDNVQPQVILNSETTGIYSLFNLMKVYNNKQGSLYNGITNNDLLYYIQSVVMDVQFQGIHIQLTMDQFLNSHYSPIVQKKRSIDPLYGGAPWLNPYLSGLKLSNEPQKFNYINSGIYDQQKLRSISQIEDNIYSSSTYQVYKSQQNDISVTVTYTSQNKVSGTNLFGFQTKIQQNDNIKGYFDMIYQPQTLNYKESVEWKNSNGQIINAYKFQIQEDKQFPVTVEQLANRTVQLSKDTFFIVQPNTGLTLEYYIKYTMMSKPFYTEYTKSNTSSSSSTNAQSSSTTGYPLYQGELYYVNNNTDKIVQISSDQHSLKVLFLLGIIFSSLSLITFIVMLFLYRKSRKTNKFGQQNKSLMSSENGSLAY